MTSADKNRGHLVQTGRQTLYFCYYARRCFLRSLSRLRIVGEGDRMGDVGGGGRGGGGGGGGGAAVIWLTCTVGFIGTCLRKFKYRWRAATYSLTF